MKKVLSIIVASVLIVACSKKDTKCSYTDSAVVAPATEIDSIQNFLSDSGLVATPNASGFFYKINNQGTGNGIANLCTNVTVTYKGTYFNGQVLDSTVAGTVATFQLGQVVVGWQKGLPLISKGGDITLYIPPTLGYGLAAIKDSQGNIIIPASSYLIFTIHIVDIQ